MKTYVIFTTTGDELKARDLLIQSKPTADKAIYWVPRVNRHLVRKKWDSEGRPDGVVYLPRKEILLTSTTRLDKYITS